MPDSRALDTLSGMKVGYFPDSRRAAIVRPGLFIGEAMTHLLPRGDS